MSGQYGHFHEHSPKNYDKNLCLLQEQSKNKKTYNITKIYLILFSLQGGGGGLRKNHPKHLRRGSYFKDEILVGSLQFAIRLCISALKA